MKEESYVRMAYLQAVLGNVYAKLTWKHASLTLWGTLRILGVANALPTQPPPVQMLESARKHLGIEPDAYIIPYAICPVCWKHYTPEQLKHLADPACTAQRCGGQIYDVKDNVRIPVLINPQVSIIGSLRRMFMRPGFAKSVSRKPEDVPGRNNNKDFIMTDMSDGEMWYKSTTGTRREVGSSGTVRDMPNGTAPNAKLYMHRFGLQLTLNTDWFGMLSGRPHSTGPVYLAINNLPRDQRYLQYNVICAAIMPGPREPTAEQLNNALEPMVKEFKQLKQGIKMEIHGEDPETVYADCICANCDTPAAHKFNGAAGHTHDFHPCPYCNANVVDIDTDSGFDNSKAMKDDFNLLKHAFRSKDAAPGRQNTILRDHGVRWAIFNTISDWLPSSKTVLDFMHNVFLGLICHFFMEVIFKSYMLSGVGGDESPKKRFEDIVNAVQWPSHITRLPKNLGENQSLKKADEWRRLLTITPVILWWAWRDANDEIPFGEPPLPPTAKFIPQHSRNYRSIYGAVLKLCTGIQILASRAISMARGESGQDFLAQYCRNLKALGIHTTINHHLSMHYTKFLKLFGPVYGWWLFAFERFNGMLEKVKHNGHDRGRMELTLMRHWVMTHLLYEYLTALPDDAEDEKEFIEEYILKENRKNRGGIMTELAIYRAEASLNNSVALPRRLGKFFDVSDLLPNGASYSLMLRYVQTLWPDEDIINDQSLDNGTPFYRAKTCRPLSYVRKDGIRFGSTHNRATNADSIAFMLDEAGHRVPIEIVSLLSVQLAEKTPHVCAIVRRMYCNDDIPVFPWDL
ncbi:hypothetical protein Hypma_014106 [Hypsizygus marmoreus]|uniref:Uncharacterized protein n=1 Tax=Hypsizygus marmoreus TaxID=39966 RepID=A0A369KEA5_HYPMA|nr:hypothetical protein Hypma_014106 [Hypsizygus marmoreus]